MCTAIKGKESKKKLKIRPFRHTNGLVNPEMADCFDSVKVKIQFQFDLLFQNSLYLYESTEPQITWVCF